MTRLTLVMSARAKLHAWFGWGNVKHLRLVPGVSLARASAQIVIPTSIISSE